MELNNEYLKDNFKTVMLTVLEVKNGERNGNPLHNVGDGKHVD